MTRKKPPPPKLPDEDGCATCRFWTEETSSKDEVRHGTCRRNPPQVVWINDDDGADFAAAQPSTVLPTWCGEFKGRLQ
jgi:hypothetical protein